MGDEEKLRLSKAMDALAYWINCAPCSLTSLEWRRRYDELSDEVIEAFRRIDPGEHGLAKGRSDNGWSE